MSLSMHQASVTAFTKSLLEPEGHAAEGQGACARAQDRGIGLYVSARLYPDMLPLSRQVQIATDIARGTRPASPASSHRLTRTTRRRSTT